MVPFRADNAWIMCKDTASKTLKSTQLRSGSKEKWQFALLSFCMEWLPFLRRMLSFGFTSSVAFIKLKCCVKCIRVLKVVTEKGTSDSPTKAAYGASLSREARIGFPANILHKTPLPMTILNTICPNVEAAQNLYNIYWGGSNKARTCFISRPYTSDPEVLKKKKVFPVAIFFSIFFRPRGDFAAFPSQSQLVVGHIRKNGQNFSDLNFRKIRTTLSQHRKSSKSRIKHVRALFDGKKKQKTHFSNACFIRRTCFIRITSFIRPPPPPPSKRIDKKRSGLLFVRSKPGKQKGEKMC